MLNRWASFAMSTGILQALTSKDSQIVFSIYRFSEQRLCRLVCANGHMHRFARAFGAHMYNLCMQMQAENLDLQAQIQKVL